MEDRKRPENNSAEVSNSDATESRQGRVRKAFDAFRDRNEEGRFWADVLSGRSGESEGRFTGDDDEAEDERGLATKSSSERLEPAKERRGRRLSRVLRSLFPRQERSDKLQELGTPTARSSAEDSEYVNYSRLQPRDISEPGAEAHSVTEQSVGTDESMATEALPVDLSNPDVPEIVPLREPEETSYDQTPVSEEALDETEYLPPVDLPPVYDDVQQPLDEASEMPLYAAARDVAVTKHETVQNPRDERLSGAVAGLLLVDLVDYVATKRREKKLEKRIDKKQNDSEKTIVSRLDTQQLKQEKLQHRTMEIEETTKKHAKEIHAPLQQVNKPSNQQRETQARLPEKQPEIQGTRLPLPGAIERNQEAPDEPVSRITHESDSLKSQPEQVHRIEAVEILKAVEQAANKNVAIESLYEKRHEARGNEDVVDWVAHSDDTSARPHAIGGSLEEWTMPQLPVTQDPQIAKPLSAKKAVQTRHAAETGIIVAVILIVIFIIIVLVSR